MEQSLACQRLLERNGSVWEGLRTPASDSVRREGATSLRSSSKDRTPAIRGRSNFESAAVPGAVPGAVPALCPGKAGPCRDHGQRCGTAPAPAAAAPTLAFPKELKPSVHKGCSGAVWVGSGQGAPSSSSFSSSCGPALPSGQAGGRAGGLALGRRARGRRRSRCPAAFAAGLPPPPGPRSEACGRRRTRRRRRRRRQRRERRPGTQRYRGFAAASRAPAPPPGQSVWGAAGAFQVGKTRLFLKKMKVRRELRGRSAAAPPGAAGERRDSL